MDERTARAALIKQNRRAILDCLKAVYPGLLSFESLCHVLPTVDERYLRVDVAYLVDKGYLEWANQQPNMAWPKREYKLTAHGVETADAINLDPALEP